MTYPAGKSPRFRDQTLSQNGQIEDPGTVDADNPWPGLAAFREADHDLFYGRESETQELLRLALRERLTVFFGLSGLGKTSLLRAGLFPLLRQENVLPVYIRMDFSDEGLRRTLAGQIRQAIALEAAAAGVEAPAFPETETVWESLHRQGAEFWSPRNRIVTPLFVFDQFEEIFTLGRGNADRAQEAETFLTELADLCEGSVPAGLRARLEADPSAPRELSLTRHPYRILLSLREDFLPELEGLRGRIRSIVHNRYRLRRMNGDQALRVITQAGGHLIEPDVPERVVRFVAGRESDEIPLAGLDVEPALLSVVCRELNNKRRAQGLPRITADLVQGNRDEIVSDLYERSIEDLGPEVRSFIEERLLTKSGFRDSVARENVVELSQEALDKLTDRRLLRIEDRGGMQRLELTHDVLTGVIRKSRDRRREREAGEREEAVRREAERKLRRSRLALALLGLVLLGVAALAVWGFAAETRARKALASSSLGRASNFQDSNPAQALAYLAQSIREQPDSVQAQSLLSDLLLYRSWPRPVEELRREDAEWVQLSNDGHLFVAASEGGAVLRIWDTRTLRKIGEIRPSLNIKEIEISRDGRYLLIVSPGRSRLWDIRTGQVLWELESEEIPRLSPDGRWLAWAREQGSVSKVLVLRDNTTRRQRVMLSGPEDSEILGSFGFSPDGRWLFKENTLQVSIWDLASGRRLPDSEVHFPIQTVVFGPDGRHLLVTGRETVLWNPEEQTEKQIGNGMFQGWLAPGGERAATLDLDSGELQIWDTRPDSPVVLATLPKREVYGAEFSPDGRRFLTSSEEGVEIWDLPSGLPVSQAFCECLHAHFLAGTDRIVTGDDTGILRVWSSEPRKTGTELYHASGNTVTRYGFSRDGSRIALQSGDGKVHLWDMDTVRPLGNPIGDGTPFQFQLSPDGRFLYEERKDGLQIMDTGTGRPAWPLLPLHISESYPAPLGMILTSGSYRVHLAREVLGLFHEEGTVELWSLSTGRQLGAAQQKKRILDFDFTAGGDLVTSSGNGIFIWDSRTGKLRSVLEHESFVTTFDLSPDGERIVTGTDYGLVRVWDLRTRKTLVGPLRHRDAISAARFELGGRMLLTSTTSHLKLWDARTGQAKSESLRPDASLRSEMVTSFQLGPDGERLLVQAMGIQSGENMIRLLDVRTGHPLARRSLAREYGGEARLSSDGQILWIASRKKVEVFPVPHFPRQDRELLARWAEAVGGWAVGEDGQLVELSDQLERLEALRRDTADAPPGELRAASLIRWFLSDPKTRPVSPVFERTIDPSRETHP